MTEFNTTTLLILSLAPVFILMTWIYFRDKYEKEPIGLILLGMLAGIILFFPAAAFEKLTSFGGLHLHQIDRAIYDGFIVAGFVEESLKFIVVYLLFFHNKNFNEKFDGIVYAVSVSLGFAAVENVLYVLQEGASTGILRAFTSVPAHTVFGIVMGFYLGLAKFSSSQKRFILFKGFLIPWLLHGLYDFMLLSRYPLLLLAFFPTFYLMWKLALKDIEIHRAGSFFRPLPPPPPDLDLTDNFTKPEYDDL